MKRSVIILAPLLILFAACGTYSRSLARGAVLGEGKVAVTGRILTEFEVVQAPIAGEQGKVRCFVHFSRDKKADPGIGGFPGSVYTEVAFADEFVVEVPAGAWYLRGIVIYLSTGEYMILTPTIEIAPGAGDRFLYLGDIVFFMQDDRVRARIDDRSADALPRCADYLADGKGRPIEPAVKLARPEDRVRLRVYRPVTTYRQQYINKQWQTTPVTTMVLVLEQ